MVAAKIIEGKDLPHYPGQKIYPYSDFYPAQVGYDDDIMVHGAVPLHFGDAVSHRLTVVPRIACTMLVLATR